MRKTRESSNSIAFWAMMRRQLVTVTSLFNGKTLTTVSTNFLVIQCPTQCSSIKGEPFTPEVTSKFAI